jgi:Zn-dependent peptidase ImmA (M78 family)
LEEIKLSGKRCEEIKREVARMFKFYGISCVPISGFEVAHKMGVKIVPYSAFAPEKQKLLLMKSEDGLLVEKDIGQWFIYYNDARCYTRINNTIMHEVGHIILDHTEDSELAEKEVKFFAKYALAPPVLVHKLKLSNPQQISVVFEISFEAAFYAYEYYSKWLKLKSSGYLKDYELILLEQFKEVI